MRACEHCGARARDDQHAACSRCYQRGYASHVDPGPVAARIRALRADGWTFTSIADAAGCSRQTVWKIHRGRVAQVRAWVSDALLAIPLARGCPVCEDVQVAAQTTTDPGLIACRVGKSPAAIEKHLRRHDQIDLARLFASHMSQQIKARRKATT